MREDTSFGGVDRCAEAPAAVPPADDDEASTRVELAPVSPIDGVTDLGLAEQLARDGYARFGTVLDRTECDQILATFEEVTARLGRPIGDEWFPTSFLPDPTLRAFIDQELKAVVLPRLEGLIDMSVLEPVRIDYSVKPPGPHSHLGPHQDFSIVDEREWTSLYMWIPLIDTDAENGTLHVLPGSHRFTNTVRSRHVPAVFDPVLDEIEARSVALDCGAGELVVMVSGVVHFSPPNRSPAVRLAAHGILKPKAAPLVFYFADEDTPDGQVEVYEVGIDQYIELALGDRPGPGYEPSGYCERPPSAMGPGRLDQGLQALAAERR